MRHVAEALSGWDVYSLPHVYCVELLLSLSVPLGVWMEGGRSDRPSDSFAQSFCTIRLTLPCQSLNDPLSWLKAYMWRSKLGVNISVTGSLRLELLVLQMAVCVL